MIRQVSLRCVLAAALALGSLPVWAQVWTKVPGALAEIAAGPTGPVYGLAREPASAAGLPVVKWDAAAQKWDALPAVASRLSAPGDTVIWALSGQAQVFTSFNRGASWDGRGGPFRDVSAGPMEAWVLSTDGVVLKEAPGRRWDVTPAMATRVVAGKDAGEAYLLDKAGAVWHKLPGTALDARWQPLPDALPLSELVVDGTGRLWGVTKTPDPASPGNFRLVTLGAQSRWVPLLGSGVKIAATQKELWMVQASGDVFKAAMPPPPPAPPPSPDARFDIEEMVARNPGPYYIVEDTQGQVVGADPVGRAMRMPRRGGLNQLWYIVKDGDRFKLKNAGTGAFMAMALNGWYGSLGTPARFMFWRDGDKLQFVEDTKNELFTLGSDGGYVRWGRTGKGQRFAFEALPPPPSVTKVVRATQALASSGGWVAATCPAGTVLLSGGALTNTSAFGVNGSGPGPDGQRWTVMYSPLTQRSSGATVGAFAVCGQAPDHEIVRVSQGAMATCPVGKQAIGGGGRYAQMTGSYRHASGTSWVLTGLQGPAEAAAVICTSYPLVNVVTRSVQAAAGLGQGLDVAASCPVEQALIGGGASTTDSGYLSLSGSAPGDGNVFNDGNMKQWAVIYSVYSLWADKKEQKTAQAQAICVPRP